MKIIVDPEFQALIPAISQGELIGLEDSIVSEGCRDALVVWKEKGTLLDGHNRYRICGERNIPFSTIELSLPDRDAAKLWILRNQLGRRNLSPGARIALAMLLEPLVAEEAKKRQVEGGETAGRGRPKQVVQNSAQPNKTRQDVARLAGVSHDTFAKGKVVFSTGDEETKEALRKGEITVNRAYINTTRKSKAEIDIPPPKGKYRVIYADPPWQYNNSSMADYGHADTQYPTMPIDRICALPIKDLAEDNAVLFIWTTSPMLEDAFQVISAWGFNYKSSFIWDKVKHNFGHYNSVRHEFLLIATHGSCTPDEKKLFDSVVSIERSEKHSEKPEEFRKIIDGLYTHGKRIELFARISATGWERWGKNE